VNNPKPATRAPRQPKGPPSSKPARTAEPAAPPVDLGALKRDLLRAVDIAVLDVVLRASGGNRTQAAKILGIDAANLRRMNRRAKAA